MGGWNAKRPLFYVAIKEKVQVLEYTLTVLFNSKSHKDSKRGIFNKAPEIGSGWTMEWIWLTITALTRHSKKTSECTTRGIIQLVNTTHGIQLAGELWHTSCTTKIPEQRKISQEHRQGQVQGEKLKEIYQASFISTCMYQNLCGKRGNLCARRNYLSV